MALSSTHAPLTKLSCIASACACIFAVQSAWAQQVTNAPTAADIQRSIEKSRSDLQRATAKPAPASATAAPPAQTERGFARLAGVNLNSALFRDEIMAYWLPHINQSVSAQQLANFKAWAWDLFQRKGYLVYITTRTATDADNGTLLEIQIVPPVIGKLIVLTPNPDTSVALAQEVARRFSQIYPAGATIDVAGFESQLNAVAYDLPVDLAISLRQVSSSVVDVVIHLREVQATPGKLIEGLVQGNNNGLSQFGRAQTVGMVRVAGFTPSSELTLTSQISKGVTYVRADYEAPDPGALTHLHTWTSRLRNEANTTQGQSFEIGVGVKTLLATDRYGRYSGGLEISKRQSKNWIAGVETQNRTDDQWRYRVRRDSSNDWVDRFNNEFIFSLGMMDLTGNAQDQLDDLNSFNISRGYNKFEMNGGLSQAFGSLKGYTGAIRWRSQISDNNLDAYNKMALGGVTGIRALTSVDGVGMSGAQVSFDLIKQFTPHFYAGALYDAGVILPHKATPTSAAPSSYTLQGAGWQMGGVIAPLNWSFSMAKSFGKKPDFPNATVTPIGAWTGYFAVSYPF